jgi:hypothetical protein
LTDSDSNTLLWNIIQQERESLDAIKGASELVYWLRNELQEMNPANRDDGDDNGVDDDDEFR